MTAFLNVSYSEIKIQDMAVLCGLYACAAEEQELFSKNKYFNINSYSLFLFLHIGMRVYYPQHEFGLEI